MTVPAADEDDDVMTSVQQTVRDASSGISATY